MVSNVIVSSTQVWTGSEVHLHQGDVIQITAAAGKGGCSLDGVIDSPSCNRTSAKSSRMRHASAVERGLGPERAFQQQPPFRVQQQRGRGFTFSFWRKNSR